MGAVSVVFYETDIINVKALEVVLLDPKYDDEKAIVFELDDGKYIGNSIVFNIENFTFSKFYNERPIDEGK